MSEEDGELREADEHLDAFVQQLTSCQRNLKAYLWGALGSAENAEEVLQRTNLALWKNARSFRPGAEFMPWALTIAKYEMLSFFRDRSRDRHVFVEEVAVLMLESLVESTPNVDERSEALELCVEGLADKHKEMLRERYFEGKTIAQIAAAARRTEGAVKVAFVRLRKSLESCVERRLRQANAV